MDRVVAPAAALLNADAPPLLLAQQPSLGERLGELLGQDDMAVAPRKARQHKKRKNINIVSSHVVKLKQGRWLHTKSGRM